jgi:sigma-B regulation protein RsbU (phosphoserine phosphatase)
MLQQCNVTSEMKVDETEGAMKKVLIAEDDPVSRRVLQANLERWGYDTLCAEDGARAWALFQRDPDIRLIISDWMMPHTDGVELCRLVRSLEGRGYTYIILLTAKSQTEDVVAGMEAGADDFVTKPFNQYELRARLRAGERLINLENDLAAKVGQLSKLNSTMLDDLRASASMLKNVLPPEVSKLPGLKYASRVLPCEQIGGDLLNVVRLDEHTTGVYVLDVSGHGITAALEALSLSMVLSPYDPHTSLLLRHGRKLGSRFILPPKGDKFITFLYGVLDSKTGSFTFVRAGHQYPIYISGGKAQEVPSVAGVPIGVVQSFNYEEGRFELKKGDRVYLYTDGLIEAVDADETPFGEERLRNLLVEAYSEPIEAGVSALIDHVTRWQAGGMRSDDISIIGIEYDP